MSSEDPHESWLFITVIVGVILSMIASMFIIVMFFCYKDLRVITFRLVFYMSVADILDGAAYLLPSEGVYCYLQAIGNTVFPLSSVLWSSVMAYCLYRVVIIKDYNLLRFEKLYLVYAYGLPLLFLVPPAATGTFGYAQGWCWITAEDETYIVGSVLRLVCFYIPLWAVIVFNLVVYCKIGRELNKELGMMSEDGDMRRALVRRLVFYPIILIVSYSFVTVKRIYDFMRPEGASVTLTIIALVFQCAVGLLNAVVYGYSDAVRERLCWPCMHKDEGPDSSMSESFTDDESVDRSP
jgi:hypothetical protein